MSLTLKAKRARLWLTQAGKCAACSISCELPHASIKMPHARNVFTVDHVIPRSKGGTNAWGNIRGLCARCNLRKGSKIIFLGNIKKLTPDMSYKIVITKLEPNTRYEEQKEAYDAQNKYPTYSSTSAPFPERHIETKKLETVLTESEFDAVRKACLGQV